MGAPTWGSQPHMQGMTAGQLRLLVAAAAAQNSCAGGVHPHGSHPAVMLTAPARMPFSRGPMSPGLPLSTASSRQVRPEAPAAAAAAAAEGAGGGCRDVKQAALPGTEGCV